ncbi:peptidylprolyl isomerase [Pusillimonas sp. 7-48]|uniref:Chaperone SurA n=2 Tax=Pusillimonas minor TaxID=2697024 RepID=A0A842HSK2_9BURK|nr:peptidylprolyl isomerase [Pusillimonas minor]MBC2770380.1 peptidylprolyl isomerase [Pusillimonas minor]
MRCVHINRRLAVLMIPVVGLFSWPQAGSAQPRAAAAPAAAPQPQRFADGIAAVINKQVITLQQVDAEVNVARKQLKSQNIQVPDDEVLRRQVLQRMITETLVRQEAERLRIEISDQQLQDAVGSVAQRNNMSKEKLRAEIEKTGVAWSYYLDSLRQEMLTDMVRQRAVDSRIVVSDAEVDAFLNSQGRTGNNLLGGVQRGAAAQQTVPRELGLAQILVQVPEGASTQQIQELRAKADSLLARVRGGADFASVAAASSDGPEALEGGNMGVRPTEGWPDLFLRAVSNVATGDVSDIVQSGNGFHILKVTTRGPEPAQPQAANAGVPQPQQEMFAQEGPMMVTQTRARHILIKIDQVTTEERALTRIRDLRQRIVMGEDFAEVARRSSDDASAPEGGDLGWLTPGETVQPFQQAMDALQPGQISEPVLTQFGWHIIQVEERRTRDMEDEFKRMRARQVLFERQAGPAFEDWLSQIRSQAFIDNRLAPRANNNRFNR